MKKIIITGSGGLLGLNLLRILNTSKYKITAIDKKSKNLSLAKLLNPNIETKVLDLSEKGEWKNLFKGADCVIQLQAQISSPIKEPYIRNNIESVKNILEACEKFKVPNLIHLSSSVVISISRDDYTKTKTIGEELVKSSNCNYTILRPPLMYGCFDIKHLDHIIKTFDKSLFLPMPGSGKYLPQPLYAKDMTKIILKLIERKPKNKIYNIIGKEKIYFIDLLKMIRNAKNKDTLFIKIPISLFTLMLRVYSSISGKKTLNYNQLKALSAGDIFPVDNWEKEFGIKYTKFNEGVSEMINSRDYTHTSLMEK